MAIILRANWKEIEEATGPPYRCSLKKKRKPSIGVNMNECRWTCSRTHGQWRLIHITLMRFFGFEFWSVHFCVCVCVCFAESITASTENSLTLLWLMRCNIVKMKPTNYVFILLQQTSELSIRIVIDNNIWYAIALHMVVLHCQFKFRSRLNVTFSFFSFYSEKLECHLQKKTMMLRWWEVCLLSYFNRFKFTLRFLLLLIPVSITKKKNR